MLHKYLLVFLLISFVLVSSRDSSNRDPSFGRYPPRSTNYHHDRSHEGSHRDHSHEGHHDRSHEGHHDRSHEGHPSHDGGRHPEHSHESHHDRSHEGHPSHDGGHHEHSHEGHPIDVAPEDQPLISEDQPLISEDQPLISEEGEEDDFVPTECDVCVSFIKKAQKQFGHSITTKLHLYEACQETSEQMELTCESKLTTIFNFLRTKQVTPHQLCARLDLCSEKKKTIMSKIRNLATRLNSKLNKIVSRNKPVTDAMDLEQPVTDAMELRPSTPEINIMELRPSKPKTDSMELRPSTPKTNIMELRPSKPKTGSMELRPSKPKTDSMELRPSTPKTNIMELRPSKPKTDSMELRPSTPKIDSMELRPAHPKSCKGPAPNRFYVCEHGEWVLHYSLSDARLLALSATGIFLALTLFTCLLCTLRRRRSVKASDSSYQAVKTVETI